MMFQTVRDDAFISLHLVSLKPSSRHSNIETETLLSLPFCPSQHLSSGLP